MASSFSTLRKQGYGTFYAIKIEGIPYIFTEGPVPYRVDSENPPGVPTGYISSSAAFAIITKTVIDQELDREAAIARGKSLKLILSWDVLEADDILDQLFRRPAYFSTIDADVTATATTINVDRTASFASSGQFYLGRELIKYSGKTSGSFTGCTRGYLGLPYAFNFNDPGSHGLVTPTPHSWKGRFVTIYDHLISPEGRILDSTWTEGTYQRELWKGHIASPPVPGKIGMRLDARPLIRIASQELGSSLTGKTVGRGNQSKDYGSIPVYVAAGTTIDMTVYMVDGTQVVCNGPIVHAGKTAGNYPALPPGVMTILDYQQAAADTVKAALAAYPRVVDVRGQVTLPKETWKVNGPWSMITFSLDLSQSGTHPLKIYIKHPGGAYWLSTSPFSTWNGIQYLLIPDDFYAGDILDVSAGMPVIIDTLPWLIVEDIEGTTALDFQIADSRLAVVEAGDHAEVIRWDQKLSLDNYGGSISPYTAIHISERQVGAQYTSVEQLPADLEKDGTIDVVAGKIGELDDVGETMLVSSGTGERGSKDTLGLGFGYGIPEEWVDLDATGSAPITAEVLPMLAIGNTSFADLFAGWYQLAGSCLCVRRSVDGVLQFVRVDVTPSVVITTSGAGFLGIPLAKADVVVGKTEVPELIIAPNQVLVDTTAGPYESAEYTFNAVGRIQSEGVHSVDLAVPGGRAEVISAAILSIMSRGKGQSIIEFGVAPWIDAQVGDPISVTVGHPLLYNWADGTRQPANIPGRCVGTSTSLKTGERTLTILLDGLLAPAFYLCPISIVTLVAGNNVTVTYGGWWQSGETVRFYNRGEESSESADLLVDTVSGNVLTLNASPPAWLTSANATRATHPAYASASSDQQNAFMYARSDRFWRV